MSRTYHKLNLTTTKNPNPQNCRPQPSAEAGNHLATNGTPPWMPPEAVESLYGEDETPAFVMDASFDAYSLGIVAHQLLTGSPLPLTCGEVGAVETSYHGYSSWWHGAGWNIACDDSLSRNSNKASNDKTAYHHVCELAGN